MAAKKKRGAKPSCPAGTRFVVTTCTGKIVKGGCMKSKSAAKAVRKKGQRVRKYHRKAK